MGFMMQIRPEVLKKLREDYGIHVAWSNGSTLAAIHGIDVIRRID